MRLPFATPLIMGPLFLFIINGVCTISSPQLKVDSQPPYNVAFCDLVKQPETHENKLVRVRASFVSNFESNMLYDVGCANEDTRVELILDCPSDRTCKDMQEILDKSLKGDPFSGMRADLVMLGRLRRVTVPSEGSAGEQGTSLTFSVTKIETTTPTSPHSPIR